MLVRVFESDEKGRERFIQTAELSAFFGPLSDEGAMAKVEAAIIRRGSCPLNDGPNAPIFRKA